MAKIHIMETDFNRMVEIAILDHDRKNIWRGGRWHELPDGPTSEPVEPTLQIHMEVAQQLANALNERGFKPEQGRLEGKLEATEHHLKDLQTIIGCFTVKYLTNKKA